MHGENNIKYKNIRMEMWNPLLQTIHICSYSAQSYLQAEQITAEYKVQALQFHPDKNAGNKEAEEKFQKLKVRTLAHIIWNMSTLYMAYMRICGIS